MWPRSTASETASRWPEEAGVNQLNYRHLYYFWVVAKEGGMARAAQRLDMAIQTISAQVRELENHWATSCSNPRGAAWC